MTREEFRDLVGRELPEEDYEIIEKVYHFHPAVNEVSGKEEVAELYKSFGMVVFYDLLPRAEKYRELNRRLNQAQAEVKHIEQQMEELTHDSIPGRKEAVMEMQGRHGIKEMLRVMDETLTGYLCDSQITEACKERIKLCLISHIEEIYKAKGYLKVSGLE